MGLLRNEKWDRLWGRIEVALLISGLIVLALKYVWPQTNVIVFVMLVFVLTIPLFVFPKRWFCGLCQRSYLSRVTFFVLGRLHSLQPMFDEGFSIAIF